MTIIELVNEYIYYNYIKYFQEGRAKIEYGK